MSNENCFQVTGNGWGDAGLVDIRLKNTDPPRSHPPPPQVHCPINISVEIDASLVFPVRSAKLCTSA